MLDIPLLALWFVCGLGAAVFAVVSAPSRTTVVMALLAFGFGAWWIRQPLAPATATVALGAALTATALVARPPRRSYSLVAAGVLAGIWSGVLEYQGLPLLVSIPASAAVPAAAARFHSRQPAFAPPRLREEALLFMVVLGVCAAALPGITDGWHAAVNLSVQGGQASPDAGAPEMPTWTLMLASGALLSGGLFSLWSRR